MQGSLLELRRPLAANPRLAAALDSGGLNPLCRAIALAQVGGAILLQETALAAALAADAEGRLPLHEGSTWREPCICCWRRCRQWC